jgi:hypothetical protein
VRQTVALVAGSGAAIFAVIELIRAFEYQRYVLALCIACALSLFAALMYSIWGYLL